MDGNCTTQSNETLLNCYHFQQKKPIDKYPKSDIIYTKSDKEMRRCII